MADWIEVGAKAPQFMLTTHDGSSCKLADLAGKTVILYFYPKDDTPGCTKEACGFRDARAAFSRHDAVVLGISPDGPEKHAAFRARHKLPFTLLCDPDHAVAESYGAWREKTLYGKKRLGIVRSTFVIDGRGRVAKVFKAVRPDGHAAQVLAALANP